MDSCSRSLYTPHIYGILYIIIFLLPKVLYTLPHCGLRKWTSPPKTLAELNCGMWGIIQRDSVCRPKRHIKNPVSNPRSSATLSHNPADPVRKFIFATYSHLLTGYQHPVDRAPNRSGAARNPRETKPSVGFLDLTGFCLTRRLAPATRLGPIRG